MNNHLLFATSNLHKLEEVRKIFPGHFTIDGLDSIDFEEEIPETHDTIAENAVEKVEFIAQFTDRPVFAEDSGLVVEALGGAPGVHSARYAGPEKSDEKNILKLLAELGGNDDRKAYFITVIAYLDAERRLHTFEGRIEGKITRRPAGTGGFGYDPVFLPDGYSRTFGELSGEVKNKISHRRRALDKMLVYLRL